jgi:tRNA(Ile)-lysidine synthase
MLTAFTKYIQDNDLFTIKDKLLVAVSGGVDSVVLCELLNQGGFKFSIAHCNFKLRGKDSERDQKFVEGLSERYKVENYVITFDTKIYAKSNKLSIQEAARKLRYEWFEKVRKGNKLDFILTAHHLDDCIETFFINLMRGTGIVGLHGIKNCHGHVRRPMLSLTKKKIEAFSLKENLNFVIDSSNDKDDYLRNKIRHHVLPVLEEINPQMHKTFQDTFDNILRTELLMGDMLEGIRKSSVIVKQEEITILMEKIKHLNPFLLYLFELIKPYGFNYETAVKVGKAVDGQPGKLFYSKEYSILIDRNKLLLKKIASKPKSQQKYFLEKDQSLFVGPDGLTLEINSRAVVGKKKNKDEKTVSLALRKLKFPLQIRIWAPGDFFYPFGMKGKKKLSDFLSDRKVSRYDKEKVFVLLSGNDICWVIGQRLDERYKLAEGDNEALIIKAKP